MTNNDFSPLIYRMNLIIKDNRQRIIEYSPGFFKADSVLLQIGCCFRSIPLKLYA